MIPVKDLAVMEKKSKKKSKTEWMQMPMTNLQRVWLRRKLEKDQVGQNCLNCEKVREKRSKIWKKKWPRSRRKSMDV